MRIICVICWAFAIPMFWVPEPERNLTNKLAAEEELAKAENDAQTFGHLDQVDNTDNNDEKPVVV